MRTDWHAGGAHHDRRGRLRNLVGTGLVEFVGHVTAVLAFSFYCIAALRYADGICCGGRVRFRLGNMRSSHNGHFSRAAKINAEVTGRLTSRSAACGDQGLHAEAARRKCFRPAWNRLLNNVMKSLTRPACWVRLDTVLDWYRPLYVAGRPSGAGKVWTSLLLSIQHVFGFHGRAHLPDREYRDAADRGFAGLDRTHEIMSELEENRARSER